jgi:hypothetical protein
VQFVLVEQITGVFNKNKRIYIYTAASIEGPNLVARSSRNIYDGFADVTRATISRM